MIFYFIGFSSQRTLHVTSQIWHLLLPSGEDITGMLFILSAYVTLSMLFILSANVTLFTFLLVVSIFLLLIIRQGVTLLGVGVWIVWLSLCLGVEVTSLFKTDNLAGKGSTPFITHMSLHQIIVNIHDGVLKKYIIFLFVYYLKLIVGPLLYLYHNISIIFN